MAWFRFSPTDEELIVDFLWKKEKGKEMEMGGGGGVLGLQEQQPLPLVERNIYGENRAPWQVLKEEGDDPWQVIRAWDKDKSRVKVIEKTIYVLTTLNKAKDSHKRIRREAGCGTWHGETGVHEIFNLNGHLIGHKKMFTFVVPEDDPMFQGDDSNCSSMIHGHWIMHEYTLAGATKPIATATRSVEYAICKIIYDETKCLKKLPPKTKKRKKVTTNDDDCVQQKRMCSATATAPAVMPTSATATATYAFENHVTPAATMVLSPPLQSSDVESLPSYFDDGFSSELEILLQCGEPSVSLEELEQILAWEQEGSTLCRTTKLAI